MAKAISAITATVIGAEPRPRFYSDLGKVLRGEDVVGGDEGQGIDAVQLQRPGEVEGIVAPKSRGLGEGGELVGPRRQVEIAGDDERARAMAHEIGHGGNV